MMMSVASPVVHPLLSLPQKSSSWSSSPIPLVASISQIGLESWCLFLVMLMMRYFLSSFFLFDHKEWLWSLLYQKWIWLENFLNPFFSVIISIESVSILNKNFFSSSWKREGGYDITFKLNCTLGGWVTLLGKWKEKDDQGGKTCFVMSASMRGILGVYKSLFRVLTVWWDETSRDERKKRRIRSVSGKGREVNERQRR
jgi:hypothetical protein